MPHQSQLRDHLVRLADHLDRSTLEATLKLMLAETRCAIRRERGLIAIERLGGRSTARGLDRLRELEGVEDQLASHLP